MRNLKIVGLILAVLLASFGLMAINESKTSNESAENAVFTGHEDHDISLEDAVELTSNFQSSVEEGARVGGFFGQEAILNILSQEGIVGIRYYYAKDNEGTPMLVLVGVNEQGQDMLEGEKLAERSVACPPFCDNSSPLLNTMHLKKLAGK